ncbi:MAG: carbonic anhydrase [Pseudanabaenaceae cyanobacterium bins.39]|nr:carbonic anhydrase [Pseudanabaenaceae cyanobacterium bins.39]
MKKLLKGLHKFQSSYFPANQEIFEQLAEGQKPRVLFITCSDSRIVPHLITQSGVGDLFIIRNAGNLVPPFGSANGGEGAAIEYAIHALGIEQVIICGHSNCGAMKGLLKLEKLRTEMPLVYEWLQHAEATRRLMHENYSHLEGKELLSMTMAENVVTQIENLKTYPVVRSKLHQGKMHIYGWIYDIESGEILAYNPETDEFESPQSVLSDAPHENYKNTSAPPIPIKDQHTDLPQNRNSGDLPSWLSYEQAQRIYRGSKA